MESADHVPAKGLILLTNQRRFCGPFIPALTEEQPSFTKIAGEPPLLRRLQL